MSGSGHTTVPPTHLWVRGGRHPTLARSDVADEPSLGELSRRVDSVTAELAQRIHRTEYTADHRYDDRRFAELEADLAQLQLNVADELKGLRASIDAATERRGSNLRQAIYAGIVPACFLLLSFAVQIWLARGGSG